MKLVLITGASTGIGREAAIYLAKKGFKVLAGVRSDKAFEDTNNLHQNIDAIKIDVCIEDTINTALAKVQNDYSPLDFFALINNAGVVNAGPLEFLAIDELRNQLEVNVTAQVLVTQKFLPLLRKVKDGRLIFTGSNSGIFTTPMNVPYSASKFAMEAIADGFRRELIGNSNIKVSLLQPAQINTPIWTKSLDHALDLKKNYPPECDELYGVLNRKVEAMVSTISRGKGSDPIVVSKAIHHALVSIRPKTRYRMGKGLWLVNFLSLLPSSWTDRILRRAIGY